jgi:cation diffusion facilitator family transporter
MSETWHPHPHQHGAQAEDEFQQGLDRQRRIMRTSLIGISANVFLAGFKAAVGLAAHSIAIVMDAVNNLSDAASSLITIVGTKLAGKEPDKKHPFGYGRVEYLTAMIIALLVLYAGITSLVESVKKILAPQTPDYSTAALVIVAAAVVVKILLGRYVQAQGRKVNSESLIDSGKDAVLDSVISASTLAAALLYRTTRISVEAWLGAAISLLILRSGGQMLKSTLSRLLGVPADPKLIVAVKQEVASFPGVRGAYDLILHDYGPDTINGSIHIEVPDTYTAGQIDELIRRITKAVYRRHHVMLLAVSIYSFNTQDEQAAQLREQIRELVMAHPYIKGMHAFYLNREENAVRLDAVISFEAPSRREVYRGLVRDLKKAYPQYSFLVSMDMDYGEL